MSTTTSTGSAAAKPSGAGSAPVKELTIRGVLIGGVITLVFTAANVYLGLKVGLTFATSIPAAVISMAILRRFSDHTIQENNIVQTIASAAGTLSAIIFVLPGLIIVGWWTGFPYLQTVLVIILGGILGVTYSIPLRRALVTNSDLPYPEGVAGAEVLRVGDTSEGAEESSRGLGVIVRGSIASAALYFLNALKAISVDISGVFRVGAGATMMGTSLSLALAGVGHLVGVGVGIAMIVGLLISYGVLLPMRTWGEAAAAKDLADFVSTTFASEVRIVGAGAIAIAAIWTFLKILGPIVSGIRESLASSAKRNAGEEIPLTERDLSMKTVIGVTVGSMLPIGVLLWLFLHPPRGGPHYRLHPLHPADRSGRRLGLWLHGRPHRLVQLADLRRRHPRGGDGGRARAHHRHHLLARRRPHPGGLHAVRHRGRLRRGHHLQ